MMEGCGHYACSFTLRRRGYWVRVQAAWLLGSRSGGVVVGFASGGVVTGFASGGVVTGFASGGVVVGSVEWVLSLRDLLTALSPNPSAGYPQKRSRFCGVRPVGKGLYTPPSGVNAGFASSGVVIPISENNLAVLARLAVLSVLSSARRLASLISGIGITRKEIRSRSAGFFVFARAKASVLGVVPASSQGKRQEAGVYPAWWLFRLFFAVCFIRILPARFFFGLPFFLQAHTFFPDGARDVGRLPFGFAQLADAFEVDA